MVARLSSQWTIYTINILLKSISNRYRGSVATLLWGESLLPISSGLSGPVGFAKLVALFGMVALC